MDNISLYIELFRQLINISPISYRVGRGHTDDTWQHLLSIQRFPPRRQTQDCCIIKPVDMPGAVRFLRSQNRKCIQECQRTIGIYSEPEFGAVTHFAKATQLYLAEERVASRVQGQS